MSSPRLPAKDPGRTTLRNLAGGSVGNLVEWYDWYAYSVFAIYFGGQFFPGADRTAQLLNTFAVFAVGFFMRPVGGWLLGGFADRHGRRAALTLTILLMSGGSLLLALAPTYNQVGVVAPVVLLVARLVQGLSIGGEFAASATFLTEAAPPGRRGLFSSFQYVSTTLGQLLALGLQILLQAVLTEDQLTSWGWRLPFVLGALFALVGLWIRRGVTETAPEGRRERTSLVRLVSHYPRQVALVVGVTVAGTVTYYTFTTYLKDYAVNSLGLSAPVASQLSLVALVFFLLLQPVGGLLSDRVGRRPLLLGFAAGFALLTVPAFTLLGADAGALLALWLLAMVLLTGYTAIAAAVMAEIVPARVRAMGIGTPYSLTVALFGGTAPYLALWFKEAGHESWFGWYVAGCAVLSGLVYLRLRETAGRPLE